MRDPYDLRDLPRWDVIGFTLGMAGVFAFVGYSMGHPLAGGIIGLIIALFINTTTR